MKFEWDEEKNILNRSKHGISFETAAYVFEDDNYIEMYDFEHSIEEDRYIRLCWRGIVCGIYRKKREHQINFCKISE